MPSTPPDGWLVPGPPQLLDGGEQLAHASATVLDFWRWAFSDLRDNYLRGILAEFLVALALGQTGSRRKAWDNFDVLTGSGLRVEVKASGYLQGWAQAKHSALSFGRVAARTWDENTNVFGVAPEVRADVFVFAVQTCKDHAAYDALALSQWEFYVVHAAPVRDCGHRTLGIGWVRQHAEPVGFDQLATEIEGVGQRR